MGQKTSIADIATEGVTQNYNPTWERKNAVFGGDTVIYSELTPRERLIRALKAAYDGKMVADCIDMVKGISLKDLNVPLDRKNNRTFLHYVAAGGREDVYNAAVELGCSRSHVDVSGVSPGEAIRRVCDLRAELQQREIKGELHVSEMLGELIPKYVERGDFYSVAAAMSRVPKPEVDGRIGSSYHTVMHDAVGQRANTGILSLMMLNGCSLGAKDKQGNTPLHIALLTGDIDTIEFLRDMAGKSELNAKNNRGDTAAHIAMRQKDTKCAAAIINGLTDLSVQNYEGSTIFHEVAKHKSGAELSEVVAGIEDVFKNVEGGVQHMVHAMTRSDKKNATFMRYAAEKDFTGISLMMGLQEDAVRGFDKGIYGLLTARDSNGATPLHMACSERTVSARALAHNMIEEAKQLNMIEKVVRATDDNERTALHVAAAQSSVDVFRELLHSSQAHGSANRITKDGNHVVHLVEEDIDDERCDSKLQDLINYSNVIDFHIPSPKTGNVPAVDLYKAGKIEILGSLLRSKALDVDARCSDGTTITHHLAVANEAFLISQCLSTRSARNNSIPFPDDPESGTPAIYALKNGALKNPNIIDMMMPYENIAKVSLEAIKNNRAALVHYLIDNEYVGVNDKLPRGMEAGNEPTTMVHAALRQGKVKLAEELVAKGAKFDGIVGECAITEGLRGGCFKGSSGARILKRLIDSGAEVNVPAGSSHTSPLMAAISSGSSVPGQQGSFVSSPDAKVIRALLEKGADLHFRDPQGNAAIHAAVISGDERVVKMLMERGACPESANVEGHTATHLAASIGNLRVFKAVVKARPTCLVHCDAATHQTALHSALSSSFVDERTARKMLQIAEKYLPARQFINLMNAQDVEGNTLMHIAASKGYSSMVKDLMKGGASLSLANTAGKTAADIADSKLSRRRLLASKTLAQVMKSREVRPEQGFTPYVPGVTEITDYGTVRVQEFFGETASLASLSSGASSFSSLSSSMESRSSYESLNSVPSLSPLSSSMESCGGYESLSGAPSFSSLSSSMESRGSYESLNSVPSLSSLSSSTESLSNESYVSEPDGGVKGQGMKEGARKDKSKSMPDVSELAELLKGVGVGDNLEKVPCQSAVDCIKSARGNAQSRTR